MPKTSTTLTTLRTAAKGLIYISESDASIKAISWPASEVGDAKTPQEAVAKAASVEPDAIETLSLDSFFAPLTTPEDWWSDEEKATGQQFATLQKSLSALPDAGVYRVAKGSKIDIYIVGHDPASLGGFAGVKTRATET